MGETDRKIIVITGATRGIGRAMASEFTRYGHTVLGCGRSASVVRELCDQFPAPSDFYSLDVADADAVKSWASLILSAHGAPHLLINNAALINRSAPLWEVEDAEFSSLVNVNIKGVANTIRSFTPAMIRAKRGVIVNFSSGWGRSVDPEVAPYCATKWAIEGLTKALAQELPSELAAVALSPGCVNTEMLRACFGRSATSYPGPEEWAKAAVPFLLSLGPEHNGESLTKTPG